MVSVLIEWVAALFHHAQQAQRRFPRRRRAAAAGGLVFGRGVGAVARGLRARCERCRVVARVGLHPAPVFAAAVLGRGRFAAAGTASAPFAHALQQVKGRFPEPGLGAGREGFVVHVPHFGPARERPRQRRVSGGQAFVGVGAVVVVVEAGARGGRAVGPHAWVGLQLRHHR